MWAIGKESYFCLQTFPLLKRGVFRLPKSPVTSQESILLELAKTVTKLCFKILRLQAEAPSLY